MLKLFTLAVVTLTVVLLHGARGGPVRRQVDEEGATRKPKVIRVPLKRFEPSRTVDIDDIIASDRTKRDLSDGEGFFDVHRSPIILTPRQTMPSHWKTEEEPSEDFFRSDVKGFEARELEEKLAEIVDAVDEQPEATEGKVITDDENQRFDVETTTARTDGFEEIEAFFDIRRKCGSS